MLHELSTKHVFETERLYLRRFTLEDAALILSLNTDPDVLKFIHEPALKTKEDASHVLSTIILPQYNFHLGRWATFLKSSDEFIGWCGLKRLNDKEIDLGYRFLKKHWNNGYATEAAATTLAYAFQKLFLEKIIARVHVNNHASRKVLQNIGMILQAEETIDDQRVYLYHAYG